MAYLKYILTIIFFQGICAYSHASGQDIVVVVNINNPTTAMTKSQVIDLFMGRYIAFPNGKKANPIELKGSKRIKKIFYEDLLGMSLARVNAYWARVKFAGRVKPSKKVSSSRKVVTHLTTSTSSISYMLREHLTGDLKVVYAFDE